MNLELTKQVHGIYFNPLSPIIKKSSIKNKHKNKFASNVSSYWQPELSWVDKDQKLYFFPLKKINAF